MTMANRGNTDLAQLSEQERGRVAAGFNDLFKQHGMDGPRINGWWNHTTFDSLKGRTPTRAWLAGDANLVRDLVQRMVDASKEASEKVDGSLAIKEKVEALRKKYEQS